METEVVVKLIGLVTALVGLVAAMIGRIRKHVYRHEHVHCDAPGTTAAPKTWTAGFLSRLPWVLIPAGLALVAAALIFSAEEFQARLTKIETEDGKTIISIKKDMNDDAKDFSITVAKDVKVIDGNSKTVEGSDKTGNRLKTDLSKAANIITDDKGEVTHIIVGGGKKHKKASSDK